MSKWIDAEWLKAFFEVDKGKGRTTPIDSLLALIDDAPSIEIGLDMAIEGNDFCSYGERRVSDD